MADNTLTYNGVTIDNLDIESYASQAIYDSANIGLEVIETTLRVRGTVALSSAASFVSSTIALHNSLMIERANLTLSIGGTNLLNVTAPDVRSGPKPQCCEFSEFTGSIFARVLFEVKIYTTVGCAGSMSNIISYVWSASHSMDEAFACKRSLRGKIVLRENTTQNNPDALRGLVFPALPNNFQRKQMDFLVSEDGLSLDFSFVDQEVYRVAPKSCRVASGRFSHTCQMLQWFSNFSITLTGDRSQTKLDMFKSAYNISKSRIDYNKEIVIAGLIEEELYENTIRLSVTTRSYSASGESGLFPTDSKIFTDLPENSDDVAPAMGPYATALLYAAKRTFYDPCVTAAGSTISPIPATGNPTAGGGTQFQVAVTPTSQAPSNTGQDSQSSVNKQDTAYTSYEDHVQYEQVNGMVVMPSTSPLDVARVYQAASPWMLITQWGTATRLKKMPKPPQPIPFGNAIVLDRVTGMINPSLQQNKADYLFGVSWKYTMASPITTANYTQVALTPPSGPAGTPSPVNYTDAYQELDLILPASADSQQPFTDTIVKYKLDAHSDGGAPQNDFD